MFPVSFKRKLSYEGHFIYEIIDKNKVEIWYEWLKKNNALFQNVEFDIDAIDEFSENTRRRAAHFEKEASVRTSEPQDEILKESDDDIPISRQYDSVISDKYDANMDAETIIDKFADMIVDFESHFNIPKDEIIAETFEDILVEEDPLSEEEEEEEELELELEESSSRFKTNKKVVHVAPGEGGKFKTWGAEKDLYLEEECYPSIFFTGEGGFLSSNMKRKKPIGFAFYVRNRLRSIDPRFREDNSYIFFLQLVKEKVELKRSIQTYCRQARKLPGLNKNHVQEIKMENLDKYNRTYSVFRNIRGTSMYYSAMKKDAMAFIRQNGPPTLFLTISYAEFQSEDLFSQVLETVLNRKISRDELDKMNFTQTEKNKLIADNVTQTTVHFERRLQKIIQFLKNEGFGDETSKQKYFVSEYFYRIEFQVI